MQFLKKNANIFLLTDKMLHDWLLLYIKSCTKKGIELAGFGHKQKSLQGNVVKPPNTK